MRRINTENDKISFEKYVFKNVILKVFFLKYSLTQRRADVTVSCTES